MKDMIFETNSCCKSKSVFAQTARFDVFWIGFPIVRNVIHNSGAVWFVGIEYSRKILNLKTSLNCTKSANCRQSISQATLFQLQEVTDRWRTLNHCLAWCKSLHSRKSFVLRELSFARMPSRQYCLSVNKLHCYNWWPELVKCTQWQPYGVVTQHGMAQILGHPKLLQKLNASHNIFQNWTFLQIQNFGQSMLGHHTIWLSLAAMN